MEANPSATALFNIFHESSHSRRRPGIRRIVELDEQLVVRQECVVDFVGVLYIIDGKVAIRRQFLQPNFRRVDKRLMYPAVFGQSNNPELWFGIPRRACMYWGERQQNEHPQAAVR